MISTGMNKSAMAADSEFDIPIVLNIVIIAISRIPKPPILIGNPVIIKIIGTARMKLLKGVTVSIL